MQSAHTQYHQQLHHVIQHKLLENRCHASLLPAMRSIIVADVKPHEWACFPVSKILLVKENCSIRFDAEQDGNDP